MLYVTILVSRTYHNKTSTFFDVANDKTLQSQNDTKRIKVSKTGLKIEASSAGKKGSLRIVEQIGAHTFTGSSENVRYHIDSFITDGIEEVEVYINTRGGSVLEASEIANQLKRLPKVTLTIGSVAASAATYLMAKFYSRGYSNSQFMIHRPKMTTSGDTKTIEADLKLLNNLTSDYRSAYAHKMQITEEEVETLFEKGDYWMTAQEAYDLKLLDEIIEENEQITSLDVAILEACGAPIIPDVEKTNTIDHMKNRNQVIAALGLAADATDEQIEARAKELAQKANDAEQLAKDAEALKEDKAKALVQLAIEEKKITADAKEHYEKLALADYDATKEVLAKMAKPTRGSDYVDPTGLDAGKDVTANWTFDEFATKDPDALLEMMTKDPKRYEALEKAHYGN